MIEKGGVTERYPNGYIRVESRPIQGRTGFIYLLTES
tara:strand:- start:403 stop:513 length:111 start_codon:yes stop_codon:yes gene_type:complete